jgi:hypothetical protein
MLGELKNPENVLVKVISISFLFIREKEEEKVSSFFCQNRFFCFCFKNKENICQRCCRDIRRWRTKITKLTKLTKIKKTFETFFFGHPKKQLFSIQEMGENMWDITTERKAAKAISSFSIKLHGFPSFTFSFEVNSHKYTQFLYLFCSSFFLILYMKHTTLSFFLSLFHCALKMRGSYMWKVVLRKLSLSFCRTWLPAFSNLIPFT